MLRRDECLLLQEEASSAKTEQEPGTPTMAEFRCCFDVTRQPLCFTGLDSRIWEANTAFCTMLGYFTITSARIPNEKTGTQGWRLVGFHSSVLPLLRTQKLLQSAGIT